MPTDTMGSTKLRIDLPDTVYDEYAKQAKTSGMDVETIIQQRLAQLKDQESFKGRVLKIGSADRQSIETVFGRSFQDGTDLARHLERAFTLMIKDIPVPISVAVLERMKSRAIRRPYPDFVAETVIRQLEHFVGLR